ncbi:hypothetical protein SK128_011723 [Halocaridina rubra]|uniref:Uncharacterized protein n=1 Tax=Halocaridina rubra TaxID=373956 RepID=A0AAN8XGZ2_HALRR
MLPKMKSDIQDPKTFTTWWAMVKANSSLIQKAKQKLGTWNLQDEHFQPGTWEAVSCLAKKLKVEKAVITLSTHQPWLLQGLTSVLQSLHDVKCDCKAEWRRKWHLHAESITYGMSLLLKFSSPSMVIVNLPEEGDSADFEALPLFISELTFSSCSANLLLECDFLSKNGMLTSDYLLTSCLVYSARVRFRRLSGHFGIEVCDRFYQDQQYVDSSEDDFPSARLPPANPTLPAIRYLEILKIKISSVDVIESLNMSLPFLELLEDLEVHLSLPISVCTDDIPQISYTKDSLTLRLDYLTDGRAEWAGKIISTFSHQYARVWLCCCFMSCEGGLHLLDQLKNGRTLVKSIHVFSANASRPDGSQFLTLATHAASLASPTTIHW